MSPGGEDLFEQQQLALEASGTGLWAWDVTTQAVTWTPVCYRLIGADAASEALTFGGFLQRVHEDDRGPLEAALAASLDGGGELEHTFRVVLRDGGIRWLVSHGRAVFAADGQAIRLLGLSVYDMRHIDEHGMRHTMTEVLADIDDDTHLHVSFDLDCLDPMEAPGVGTGVRGGPTYREMQLCMEMIADTGQLRSLDVVEINPALDVRNRTAELAVDFIQSLFGASTLAR